MTDSTPAHNPDQIWQFNDGIEFYLDAADRKLDDYGNTEYKFGFEWVEDGGSVTLHQEHGQSVEKVDFMVKNTETGYCVEAAFLWKSLGTDASAGAHIGVEVQVNDNRGQGCFKGKRR